MSRSHVFVSYRHSDGRSHAERAVALLRGAGLPVWFDTDLPAGHIRQHIDEALDMAEAGVMVVTEDLVNSDFIQNVEAPALIRKMASERLPLMVVNTCLDPVTGRIDPSKPDALIRKVDDVHLDLVTQTGLQTEQECQQFVRALLQHRIKLWLSHQDDQLDINLQTVLDGDALHGGDLEVIVQQDEDTDLPTGLALSSFALGLPELARACNRARITNIALSGQIRLSLAVAVGAMFPQQKGFAPLKAAGGWGEDHDTKAHHIHCQSGDAGGDDDLLVLVQLKADANVHSFDRLRDEVKPRATLTITLQEQGWIDPGEGARLAREIGEAICAVAADKDVERVHLCIMGPWQMAALIGAQLNRLTVVSYEHTGRDYVAVVELRPSGSRSIIPLLPRTITFDTLVNLTPHAVSLVDEDGSVLRSWPAAERWARLSEVITEQDALQLDGVDIPSDSVEYGSPVDLPTQQDGVGLIVSRVLADHVRRPDLVFPGDEVRDDSGRIIGCRRLDAFKPVL